MDPAMQQDSLKYLSSVHRKQFQERRSVVEFRCFFTTLTFYVLSFLAIYKGDINISSGALRYINGAFLVVAFFSTVFIAYVHMAGNKDKELAERAEDGLRDIIGGKSCRDQEVRFDQYFVSWSTICKKGKWGYIWQTVTIWSFAVIAMRLIYSKIVI